MYALYVWVVKYSLLRFGEKPNAVALVFIGGGDPTQRDIPRLAEASRIVKI